MIVRIFIFTAIVSLAVTHSARADHAWQPMPGHPNAQVAAEATDPLLAEYIAVSQTHWGAVPSCPGASEGAPPVPFHFVYYSDPGDGYAAWADQPGCRGWLNGRDWWPTAQRSEGWCVLAAHEVGHSVGQAHSDNPRSVMYSGSQRWEWEGLIPGCAQFNPQPSVAPAPSYEKPPTVKRRRCVRTIRPHGRRTRPGARWTCRGLYVMRSRPTKW